MWVGLNSNHLEAAVTKIFVAGQDSIKLGEPIVWTRHFFKVLRSLDQFLRDALRIFARPISTTKRGMLSSQMLEAHPSVTIGEV